MKKILRLLASLCVGGMLLSIIPCALAESYGAISVDGGAPRYTIKSSCTPTAPVGYSLVKVAYVAGGPCSGGGGLQYDFMELANLIKVNVCTFQAPPGWVTTGMKLEPAATCGYGDPVFGEKPRHEITKISGNVLDVCNFIPPAGWVVTGSRFDPNNVCGPKYPRHTITRLTNQVDLITCNYIAPAGWVVTELNVPMQPQCRSSVNEPAFRIKNLAGLTQITMCSKYLNATLKKPDGWNILSSPYSSSCGTAPGNSWAIMSAAPLPPKIPLYLYASESGDRIYTVTRNDAGHTYYGFSYVGVMGYVLQSPTTGSVPFSRYYSAYGTDHFYTTERNDAGYAAYTFNYEGTEGHVFNVPAPGTVPLYQYYNAFIKNRYYALNYFTNGAYGYSYEKIAAYVYPAP